MTHTDDLTTTIACIQMEPAFGEPDRNRAHLAGQMAQACAAGARILIAPELCISGYAFRSREEAWALSEPADGPSCADWTALAAMHDVCIVGGICERDGDVLYNSAIAVGPGGLLGTYRKNHLWDEEHTFFALGNLGFPVFETPFGKIGILICYDLWFPEAFRSCVLGGADIVCLPTAWLPIPERAPNTAPIHHVLAMAAAHVNSVPVACANRIGRENGKLFIGQSLIAGHTGRPVAGPAGASEENILVATVNLSRARRERKWGAFNHLLTDRRPDIYRTL